MGSKENEGMMQIVTWEVHPGAAVIQHVWRPPQGRGAVCSEFILIACSRSAGFLCPEVVSPLRGGVLPHWTVDRLGPGREEARDG